MSALHIVSGYLFDAITRCGDCRLGRAGDPDYACRKCGIAAAAVIAKGHELDTLSNACKAARELPS